METLAGFGDRSLLRGVLFLAIAGSLACDVGLEVQGIVRGPDCGSGELVPLADVEVVVLGAGGHRPMTHTDPAGRYRLRYLTSPPSHPSSARVRFSTAGYRSVELALEGVRREPCGRGCWVIDVELACAGPGEDVSFDESARQRGWLTARRE